MGCGPETSPRYPPPGPWGRAGDTGLVTGAQRVCDSRCHGCDTTEAGNYITETISASHLKLAEGCYRLRPHPEKSPLSRGTAVALRGRGRSLATRPQAPPWPQPGSAAAPCHPDAHRPLSWRLGPCSFPLRVCTGSVTSRVHRRHRHKRVPPGRHIYYKWTNEPVPHPTGLRRGSESHRGPASPGALSTAPLALLRVPCLDTCPWSPPPSL